MQWLDYYWHKKLKRPYSLDKRIDIGKGQPVVFLHGLASSGAIWQPVVDELDNTKYRMVALDLLGFGNSPQPDWLEYSVEDHAKAVVATLKRNRITKPVILIGHSMGSMVAAYIAQRYPKLVKHLILYQMPVYSLPQATSTNDYMVKAYVSTLSYLADHPRSTLFYSRILGKVVSDVAGFSLDESGWKSFESSLRNTIMQKGAFENINSLQIPVDVIIGRYDMLVLRNYVRKLFHANGAVNFHEIKEIHRVSKKTAKIVAEIIREEVKS
jgi:pimeloyl-ACP methyl ester carboxylesterase